MCRPSAGWLYSSEAISAYNAQLYTCLAAWQPVLIYVKGDVPRAFSRAVAERGKEWLTDFLERINWHFRAGHYAGVPLPLRSLEDVFAYFEEMDVLLQKMVNEWPGRCVRLDTLDWPIEAIKKMLMDFWQKEADVQAGCV